MIAIEEMPPQKPAKKTAEKPEAAKPVRPMLDAERFAGNAVVLHHKLNRALEELTFYRVARRHHSERETNEVRGHREWVAQAEALCLALRDAIHNGLLEPPKPQRDEEDD